MSADRPAKGLGMGLQALLGEASRPAPAPGSGEAVAARGGVREVDMARIRPNPEQPRVQFDEEALDELAEFDPRARRAPADPAEAASARTT